MSNVVQSFIRAVDQVFKYFKCPAEYLLKSLTHMQWRIWEDDGIFFLTYWNEETPETSLIMVRKDGRPLIYETGEYTLAIAIDCVKTGFILYNGDERALSIIQDRGAQ